MEARWTQTSTSAKTVDRSACSSLPENVLLVDMTLLQVFFRGSEFNTGISKDHIANLISSIFLLNCGMNAFYKSGSASFGAGVHCCSKDQFVHLMFPSWWWGKQICLINDALRSRVLCSTLLSEVHCTELSEGLDTDIKPASAPRLLVPSLRWQCQWRTVGSLVLLFAVAAQCGVVERVLNKWWSCWVSRAVQLRICTSFPSPNAHGTFDFGPLLFKVPTGISVLPFPVFADLSATTSPFKLLYKSNLVFLEARQLFTDHQASA